MIKKNNFNKYSKKFKVKRKQDKFNKQNNNQNKKIKI